MRQQEDWELDAAQALYLDGMPVTVANPQRHPYPTRSIGELAKTDDIEAGMLARYVKTIKPELSRFLTEEEKELVALVRRQKTLVQTGTKEKIRRKSAKKASTITYKNTFPGWIKLLMT